MFAEEFMIIARLLAWAGIRSESCFEYPLAMAVGARITMIKNAIVRM